MVARPSSQGDPLRRARDAWGLTVAELARRADLTTTEVEQAERGELVDPSVLADLAHALGGTFDDLHLGRRFWDAPALAFKQVGEKPIWSALRPGLIRAVRASRLRAELCEILGRPDAWRARPKKLVASAVQGYPAHHGRALAKLVRSELKLGEAPIASVRSLLSRLGVFSVLVDWEELSDLDGVLLQQQDTTPLIALNVRARGAKTTALRLTAAHELCHALFDRHKKGVAALIESHGEVAVHPEQRANSFAAHLLAPETAIGRFLREHRAAVDDAEPISRETLRAMSSYFGMGVEALAAHLVNCGVWDESDMARHAGLVSPPFPSPDDREFRVPTTGEKAVPLEQRGEILDMACDALRRGLISAGRWRELLDLWDDQSARVLMAERELSPDEPA